MNKIGIDRGEIIVPLDCPKDEAIHIISSLHEQAKWFKIGLQLISAGEAPAVVEEVLKHNGHIMYDAKFHDIPNTVKMAVRGLQSMKINLLTVHCSGGRSMLESAVTAASELSFCPQVVGVTVLTSLSELSWKRATGSQWSPSKAVEHMVREGYAAGIRVFVCSPQEIRIIRGIFGDDVTVITPGVRPVWYNKGDQERVHTPAEAIKAGADALVIGRPIISPPEAIGKPVEAFREIKDQIIKELV